MNNAVKDLLLVVLIVVVSLGAYIIWEESNSIKAQLYSIECDIHNKEGIRVDIVGTCDARFWKFKRMFDEIDPNLFEMAVREDW